jgi:predicted TIM-barrel fold metal-dependent hydrolase
MNASSDMPLVPLTDFHMHLASQQICDQMLKKIPAEVLGDLKPTLCTADMIISLLDKAGIRNAFVLSNAYGWGMDFMQMGADEYDWVKFENDFTAAEAAQHPHRLKAFFSFNPLKEYAAEELIRCHEKLHMPGLKLHFTNSNVDLTDPTHVEKVRDVLKMCAVRSIPVLIHSRSRNPEFGVRDVRIFVDEILLKLPTLKVQMAHLGDWGAFMDVTRDVFETFIQAFMENPRLNKNRFWFDISGVVLKKPIANIIQPATPEQLTQLANQIRRWGVERMLFGSDYFAFEPTEYMQTLLEKLPFTKEEFRAMFLNDWQEMFAV